MLASGPRSCSRPGCLGHRVCRLDGLFQAVGRRSVVVRDEGPRDVLTCLVVVPDRGGQREDPRQDTGEDALVGASAVSFEVKLAFKSLVDGLDDLPQRLAQVLAGA